MTRGSWRTPLFAGTLLALAGAGLFGPAPAWAGCGDYVVLGPSVPGPHTRPTTLPMQRSPDSPTPSTPCRGPFCSRGTLPPLLPVASPGGPVEEGCPLSTAPGVPDPEPTWGLSDFGLLHPIESSASIYHPPRSRSVRVNL
jgi:hypothetical protein